MMTSPMDPLDRQLEDLPAVRASAGFKAEVMKRLDDLPEPRLEFRSRRLVWGAIAAAVAGLALLTLVPVGNEDPSAGLTAEVTEIRREHELLTQELNRLRARTESTAPVLYLGGVDEVDYVLDLSPFFLPQTGGVLPASTNDNTTF
ncbi:MAG: hypothetical protein GY769_22980 [bacterium]|nr:hypothetical protein [bacterium]